MPGRIRSFLFVAHIYYANLQDIQVNRCIYSIETDWRHVHCTLYVHSSVCIYSGLCIITTCTKLVNNLTITNCYISQKCAIPSLIIHVFNLAIFFFWNTFRETLFTSIQVYLYTLHCYCFRDFYKKYNTLKCSYVVQCTYMEAYCIFF